MEMEVREGVQSATEDDLQLSVLLPDYDKNNYGLLFLNGHHVEGFKHTKSVAPVSGEILVHDGEVLYELNPNSPYDRRVVFVGVEYFNFPLLRDREGHQYRVICDDITKLESIEVKARLLFYEKDFHINGHSCTIMLTEEGHLSLEFTSQGKQYDYYHVIYCTVIHHKGINVYWLDDDLRCHYLFQTIGIIHHSTLPDRYIRLDNFSLILYNDDRLTYIEDLIVPIELQKSSRKVPIVNIGSYFTTHIDGSLKLNYKETIEPYRGVIDYYGVPMEHIEICIAAGYI